MKALILCTLFGLINLTTVYTSILKAESTEHSNIVDGFNSNAFAVQCRIIQDGEWFAVAPFDMAALCPGTGNYCGYCFDTTAPAPYNTEVGARNLYLSIAPATQTEGIPIIVNGVNTKIVPYYRNVP